jgi:hypothetical protein
MSTKIYNAYKYNGSLYNLLNQLKDIRKEYQEEKIELLSHFTTLEIEVENGRKVMLKDLDNEILGDMFFVDYLEKRMKIGYNEPENISASVVLYPYKNDIYLHFFGLKQKYIDKIDGLIDFHYQNQSDQSNYDWEKEKWEEMSEERQKELEEDWDNRASIWDEILGYNTPSESGFSFEFHPHGYHMSEFCRKITKKKNK